MRSSSESSLSRSSGSSQLKSASFNETAGLPTCCSATDMGVLLFVIPGRRKAESPESITTKQAIFERASQIEGVRVMDSGLTPSACPGKTLPLQPHRVRAKLGPADGAAGLCGSLNARQRRIPVGRDDAIARVVGGFVGDQPDRGRAHDLR